MAKETYSDIIKGQIGRVRASAKADNYFPIIGETVRIDANTRWGQTSEWQTRADEGEAVITAGNLTKQKDSKSILIAGSGELQQKFIARNKLFSAEVLKTIYAMQPQALPYFHIEAVEVVRVGFAGSVRIIPDNGYFPKSDYAAVVKIIRENEAIPVKTITESTGRPTPNYERSYVFEFKSASDRGIYDVEVEVTDIATGIALTQRHNKLITVTPELCPKPDDTSTGYEVVTTYQGYTGYIAPPKMQTFEIRLWRDVNGSGLNYAEMIIPSGNVQNAHWYSADISGLPAGTTLCLKRDPQEAEQNYPMRLFINGNKDHTVTNENGTPNFTYEKPLVITHDEDTVFDWGWRAYGAFVPMNNIRNVVIDGRGYHNTGMYFHVFDESMFSDTCLFVNNGTSEIEIFGLEIYGAGFAGIAAKTDPNPNNPFYWRENGWEMGLKIHHCKFRYTVGEGVYIGYFNSQTLTGKNASGKEVSYHAHLIRGLRVYRCEWENNGYDSVQINNTVDAEFCYCHIKGSAYRREPNQDSVFSCTFDGKIYNCIAEDSHGLVGVVAPLMGNLEIFNNILIGAKGSNGLMTAYWSDSLNENVHPDDTNHVGDEFKWHIYNNIIKAAKPLFQFGDIKFSNFRAWDNVLLYEDGEDAGQLTGSFAGSGNVVMKAEENYVEIDAAFKVADSANNNFQPAHNSPLVTAGENFKAPFDMRGYKKWYNSYFHAGPFQGIYKDTSLEESLVSYEDIELKLPLSELGITNANDVAVSFANLKYDKKFAVMWEIDDALSAPYNAFMKYTHKKWVDYKENYREFLDKDTNGAKSPKGDGEFGTRLLCHTDGCGNDIPFKYSSAWFSFNNANSDGIHDDTVYPYQYISWRELQKFLDFGNYVSNHGGGDQADAMASVRNNQMKVKEKVGAEMYMYVEPGGVSWGEHYERNFDWFVGRRSNDNALPDVDNVNVESLVSPFHCLNVANYFLDNAVFSDYKGYIDTAATQAAKRYILLGNHNIKFDNTMSDGRSKWENAKQTLDYVYDTYGKGGDDSVWFPSSSEFVEYLLSKTLSTLEKSVVDGYLVLKGKMLKMYGFNFKQTTILIAKSSGTFASGVDTINTSDNVVNVANGVKDGKLLINVDWNDKLPGIAEKYTALYETEQTSDAKYDALFMCSRLKPVLAKPFLDRIHIGDVAPVLNSIQINSGAPVAYEQAVSVTFNVTGFITHCKVSETSDLSGAEWIENTSKVISFNLSGGHGTKTVYVRVKNDFGETEIKSSSISYEEAPAEVFTVTGVSNNQKFGVVSPASQVVAGGGVANLTAQANSGYVIESWVGADTFTGVGAATGTARVTNVQVDKEVTCSFKEDGGGTGATKAIIFTHSGNPSYPSLSNGDIVNRLTGALASDTTINEVKDVKGNSFAKRTVVPAAAWRPETYTGLTGNAGAYPDEYIMMYGKLYSSAAHPDGVVHTFSEVAPGNYRVSLLISVAEGSDYTTNKGLFRYTVNGSEKSIPDSMNIANNVTEWIVYDSVTVGDDGLLTLKMTTTTAWKKIPLNVIEIVKLE